MKMQEAFEICLKDWENVVCGISNRPSFFLGFCPKITHRLGSYGTGPCTIRLSLSTWRNKRFVRCPFPKGDWIFADWFVFNKKDLQEISSPKDFWKEIVKA